MSGDFRAGLIFMYELFRSRREETIYYINDKVKWILKKLNLYELLVKGRCLIYTMIEHMF